MGFNSLLGQSAAIRILKDELDSGRIHHAYLFIGKDGVGKKTLALEFAKAVHCQNGGNEACDQCLSCRKIDHSNHPDHRIIGIEEGDTIKIDQIRDLQRDMAYKPYESERKIFIIDDADRLTPEAANSLLKTLEEPPQYGIIILLAEELDKLLPTVISRCQKIQLNIIAAGIIEKELKKNGYNSDMAKLIASLADGSMGRAISLIEDDNFLSKRKDIIESLYKLPKLNAVDIFNFADDVISLLKDKDFFSIFHLILTWYRDIILYNLGYDKGIVNYDYIDLIESSCQDYSLEELISIVELVNTIKRYIHSNVRKDLALQVMFFKIRAKRVN